MPLPLKLIVWILGLVITLRLVRFATTPLLRWLGYYTYYSPMFFTMLTPTTLEIHLGTSYDFFLHNPSPRLMMRYLAEGLVNLCEAIEKGQVDRHRIVKGTVYYINDSNLQRFGFEPCTPNLLQWLLFLQNYLEACLLLTLSKRKLSLVNIGSVRRVKVMAADLLPYKEKYAIYLRCLENEKAALLQLRSPDALPRRGPSLIPSATRLSAWQKVDKRAVGSN